MVALTIRRAAKSIPKSAHRSRPARSDVGYFTPAGAPLTSKRQKNADSPNPAFVFIREIRGPKSESTKAIRSYPTWGADVSGSLQGAGGVGGLLMAEETILSGTTQTTPIPHYYHYDGNGNVIAITDATGTTEGRYRYTAFGGAANTVTDTTFAATQPYRFSTKYLDKEVETAEGTYFYGYRHYVPVIGRWPSRDPIAERGGRNLYGMIGNDALGRVDVLGLATALCNGKEYDPAVCCCVEDYYIRKKINGCCPDEYEKQQKAYGKDVAELADRVGGWSKLTKQAEALREIRRKYPCAFPDLEEGFGGLEYANYIEGGTKIMVYVWLGGMAKAAELPAALRAGQVWIRRLTGL